MNAPWRTPRAPAPSPTPETLASVRRQRTARELADTLLFWHGELEAEADRTDQTPEDLERRGNAAYLNAEGMAAEAAATADLDSRILYLVVAGRYACKARVCRARARELRGE